jgi:Flp pilus assembly protein TadG
MSTGFNPVRLGQAVTRRLRSDEATQIVEFAISLPLLVLFVIGIFDFSSAITLRQKLANAAREGARVAAADPANDLSGSSSGVPVSVSDAFQAVDTYLLSENINDCKLGSQKPIAGGPLVWSSNAQGNGCPTFGVTFTISRGYYFAETGATQASASCIPVQVASGQIAVVGTCVTVQYAYQWQFGGVSGLFGKTFVGPSILSSTAVAFDEN